VLALFDLTNANRKMESTVQSMVKKCSAFTLIELLIVVAIIAILAAIAVPNFLEAQTRAKVARVKNDMRSLATAVESYAVDNNKPPVRFSDWNGGGAQPFPHATTKIFDPAVPAASVGMKVLTSPISYMSSVPEDVFNTPIKALMAPGNGYSDALDYWDPLQSDHYVRLCAHPISPVRFGEAKGYMLFSVGPDRSFGVNPSGFQGYPEPSVQNLNTYAFFYDATNGTVSSGNVFRFAGGLEQGNLRP